MASLTISMEMIVFLVALALIFDFMNGFHDAANSIATIVSTGVLKPQYAVMWAAFFNFVAIAVFQLKVAGGIVWAWILTISCSAFTAAVAWWLAQQFLAPA